MNHTEFFRSLRAGDIRPVYLFCGEERHVLASAVKQLIGATVPEETRALNLTRLPETATGAEICAQARTIPFMGEKRVVIVENSVFLTKSGEDEDLLAEYLEYPTDTTVLLFICEKPDKRKRIFKALQNAAVVEFNPLSDSELTRWVEKTLHAHGRQIEPNALSFLLEYADPRPEALAHELDKLIDYRTEGAITRDDILALTTPCADYNVFKMTDALIAKNEKTALLLLSGLLAAREEPIFLLGAISRQYKQMLRLKYLKQEHADRAAMLKTLGVRDFVLTRLSAACDKMTMEQAEKAVELCLAADEGLKSGTAFDTVALQTLAVKLCRL